MTRPLSPDHPRAIFAAPRAEAAPPSVADLRGRIRELEERGRARDDRGAAPDPGEILATFPRTDGTVLRVAVRHWKDPKDTRPGPGAPFVDVRVWQSSAPDAWPVKGKGLSVRPRELATLAAALLDAADRLSRGAP